MTLIEVLAPFGVTEDEFVDELSRDLRATPDSSASRLTESEESVLREHGGITSPVGEDQSVRRSAPRSSSSNLAEQTRESLSVEQAATLLMVEAHACATAYVTARSTHSRSAADCGCRSGSSTAMTRSPGFARCSRRCRPNCTRSRCPGS